MLGDNISKIRKERGLTQEALAVKLHVVRQTVSKWEKGKSVPDAETLLKIAEALEAPPADLLGEPFARGKQEDDSHVSGAAGDSETNASNASIVKTLAEINEQLAIKNRRARRVWKAVGFTVLGAVILNILLIVLSIATFHSYKEDGAVVVVDGNGLPSYDSLNGMSDYDITQALLAAEKQQLHEAWGEPASTKDHADVWEISRGVLLKVQYDENGLVTDCGRE